MNNINLIWFICLIIFLKETSISISYLASMLHQDIGLPSPLRPTKSSEVAFVLEAIYKKKGGLFKYLKVFQCDNGCEFKVEVMKLLEKHNVDIGRATAKYKHTHTAVVEASNKGLEKLLFKPMDAQGLQNPKKVLTISVKNLDPAVKRLNNTVMLMIDMKPKDAIKLDAVPLNKTFFFFFFYIYEYRTYKQI